MNRNSNSDYEKFLINSQGNIGIKTQDGEVKVCLNKKELNKWRIMCTIAYVLWFFFGGEVIGDNVGALGFIISFAIPYFIMHYFYKKTFFKRIYGVDWSKKAEDYVLGGYKNKHN